MRLFIFNSAKLCSQLLLLYIIHILIFCVNYSKICVESGFQQLNFLKKMLRLINEFWMGDHVIWSGGVGYRRIEMLNHDPGCGVIDQVKVVVKHSRQWKYQSILLVK